MKHLATIVAFLLGAPLFAQAAAPISISEIAWAGSAASLADEWLEVCGPPETDLTNWTIEGASASALVLPAGSLIPSSGAFLIANYGADDAKTTLAVAPNVVTTSIALSNAALFISLRDASGSIIDLAGASGSAPLAGASGNQKASMERLLPLVDGATSAAWETAFSSSGFDPGLADFGTPGTCPIIASATGTASVIDTASEAPAPTEEAIAIAAPPLAPTTAVRISEAYPAPLSGEKEWIELTNPSGTGELLDGWTLEDGKGTATVLAGTILPWSRLVIVAPKGTLNNDGDLVVLKDHQGRIVDGVAYGNWDTALYPRVGHVGKNEALMRLELQNTFDVTTVSTPNAANVLMKKVEDKNELSVTTPSDSLSFRPKQREAEESIRLQTDPSTALGMTNVSVHSAQDDKKTERVAAEKLVAKSSVKKVAQAVAKKPAASRYKGSAYVAEIAVAPGVYGKTRLYVLRAGAVQEMRFSKSSNAAYDAGKSIAFIAQEKNDGNGTYLLTNPGSVRLAGASASTTFATIEAWPDVAGAYRFSAEVVAAHGSVLEVRFDKREGDVLLPTTISSLKPGDIVTIEGFVSPGVRPRVVLPSASSVMLKKSVASEIRASDQGTTVRLPWPATVGLTIAALISGILVYLRGERLKRLQLVTQPIEEEVL